jgi:hypothetical protein
MPDIPLPTQLSDSGAWFQVKPSTVDFSPLVKQIELLSSMVAAQISTARDKKSSISVSDMFSLQAAMNKLSQFSDAASNVIAGLNSAATSVARNIKS